MLSGRSWRFALFGAVISSLGAVAFVACGNNDGARRTTVSASDGRASDGTFDYGSLSGSLRVDGSSTVFPIAEAVAEEFVNESDVRVNVAFSGTGGGFERFCRGEIEVSNASRPIDEDEINACAEEGVTDIVELQVAIDALTVVAHPDNDFLDCLTVRQLHDIFTGTANSWSDVDPSFADEDIARYFPGADSGTFDYFVEIVIEGVDEDASHTGDGTASEDDNVLALGVEGDDNGLGYFGFAYFQGAGQALKPVAIDSGEGCVEPSLDAALDGSYQPLSRPLFIYTRESFLRERPDVLGFVHYFMKNTNVLSEEVGYVPMPEDVLAEQQGKVEPFVQ